MKHTDQLHIKNDLIEVMDDLLRHWNASDARKAPRRPVAGRARGKGWLPTRVVRKLSREA